MHQLPIAHIEHSSPLDRLQEPEYLLSSIDRSQMNKLRTDLLQGTLDLMVLRTLDAGPNHGWGISQRIQQISQDVLRINQGSLYPSLHRLEHEGWIEAEWGSSDNNRRAKFYRLTETGQAHLERETAVWQQYAQAVRWILQSA